MNKIKLSSSFSTLISSSFQGFSSGEIDFHFYQFLSNFFKYLSSNFPLSHLNKIFPVYFPGNSLLLNFSIFGFNFIFHLSSIPFCLLTSAPTLSSNSSTSSLVFFFFFFFSHISFSTINLFQHTKYFSTPTSSSYSISS